MSGQPDPLLVNTISPRGFKKILPLGYAVINGRIQADPKTVPLVQATFRDGAAKR